MSTLLVDVKPFKPTIVENNESTGITELVGVLQRAEAKNQNNRIYSKPLLERECKRYIEEFVKQGNAYGELDHPENAVISLKNASHVIKEIWWEDNDLYGRLQLLNTPSGNIAKNIILDGHTIGISSRGTGSLKEERGLLQVQSDYELVGWDLVSNPSTHRAFVHLKDGGLNESSTLSKKDQKALLLEAINANIREILCETSCYCEL